MKAGRWQDGWACARPEMECEAKARLRVWPGWVVSGLWRLSGLGLLTHCL